jgi:hypothetical protein
VNVAFGEMRFAQVATSIRVPRPTGKNRTMVHARSPGTSFIYSSLATMVSLLKGLSSYDKTMTILQFSGC